MGRLELALLDLNCHHRALFRNRSRAADVTVTQRTMTYSLKTDGFDVELTAYDDFIKPQFPSYEIFWQKFVVPLTHRPGDKQLKTDVELAAIGKGHKELCLAQLHYTVLLQLDRSRRLMRYRRFRVDHLVSALSTLVGAQDCAFELLERFADPTEYDPWLDKKVKGGAKGSKDAKEKWQTKNKRPLQSIRDYRNCLVHGRTLPGIHSGRDFLVPRIGKETAYFDWRLVTSANTLPLSDFEPPLSVMKAAFEQTVFYIESKWKSELLPYV